MFPRSPRRPALFRSRLSPYSIAGKPLGVSSRIVHLLSYPSAARAAIARLNYSPTSREFITPFARCQRRLLDQQATGVPLRDSAHVQVP